MRCLLVLYFFVFQSSCFGLEIQFVGPCSEKPFYSVNVDPSSALDVGNLSISVLEEAKIQYLGTSTGLNQIFNSPIGLEALEIVSEKEMMAYGWCFEVDGKIPELYPNEVHLEGIKVIRWFFAYAHYLNGHWESQCLKSYLRLSPFVCAHSLPLLERH